MGTYLQLPAYTSHKIVRAAKIAAIDFGERLDLMPLGVAEVGAAWVAKHNPQPGGYYVAYADGYSSYSPAEAFESGYTPVEGPRVIDPGHRYRIGGAQVLQFMKKERQGDAFVMTAAGTTNEELIDVLLDRLRTLNATVQCRENSLAITKLEEAKHWLDARTRNRQAQGVEGTAAAHA